MVSFLTILGALALAGGSVGYFMFPLGLNMGIKSFINLKENGMVYPIFMKPPFGGRSEFRLFAIRNPREVLRGGKMKVEIKGPYVYNSYLVRENEMFTKKGERLKYDSHRMLVIDEASSKDLDEKMWLLNPILPTTLKIVKTLVLDRIPFQRLAEPIIFNTVNLLLDNFKERLILKTTPRMILDGRKVEMLAAVSGVAKQFGLASIIPPGPPQNVFGLAFVQNETTDSLEIWTGIGPSVDRFAEVSSWRGQSAMKIWRGKCNIINGTNGELYKPFIEEGRPIQVFLPPLCRTLQLDPVGDAMAITKTGIRALEYELTPRLYLGARSNPSNKCFCEDTRTYDCQYDGLINMGPCFFDTPIFFTEPTLRDMDRKILNTVDERTLPRDLPDKQSFMIEPLTGTVLEVNLTLVAVFKVVRQPYMRDLSKVQDLTYAPFFAATEAVVVPYEFVWQVYFLQKLTDNYKPLMVGTALSGTGLMALKWMFGS